MSIKKENIVHDIKTAGIVAGLSLTLNACHERPLIQQQLDTIAYKTDSAVNMHPEYRFTKKYVKFAGNKVDKLHTANCNLVKNYSKSYIKTNISKSDLRTMMLKVLSDEEFIYDENELIECYVDTVADVNRINAHYIRRNERWFFDLMMYLNNNYSDRQLLNSEFFNVIQDKNLKHEFELNTKEIEKLQDYIGSVSRRGDEIYNQIQDKCVNEVKKSKQR